MSVNTHDMQADCNNVAEKTRRRRGIPAAMRSLNAPETVAIRHLSRFSMLTPMQLARLMNRSERTAQDALYGLSKAELVCCGGVLQEDYSIHIQTKPRRVYSLNKDGVTFVEKNNCSMIGVNRKPIARSWNDKLIADKEINHKLGIVNCMISLCQFVERLKDFEVTYLAPDFMNNDDGVSINKTKYDGGSLIPDVIAFVMNKQTGEDRAFYIEYDRGTEAVWVSPDAAERTKKAEAAKVIPICDRFRNYDTFFKGDQTKTSDKNPSILWVCETDEALRRIRESKRINWASMTNIQKRLKLSTIDNVKANFLGANWHMPDTDEVAPIVKGSPE